jgi:hypothetical protein
LTFQVKGTSSGSDKTVGNLQDNFRSGTGGTLCNGWALHAVPFTQGKHLFSL